MSTLHEIRAKMQAYSVKPGSLNSDGELVSEQVLLAAVYSNAPDSENYSYSKATPSATLSMQISNPDAMGFFQEGKQYVISFEKAD